jgi:hypothetical protein
MKKYCIALCATAALAFAAPATAASVLYGGTTYSTGTPLNINFSGQTSSALGSLTLTLTGTQAGSTAGETDYLFSWSLANPISNSTSALNPFANISGFGFNVTNATVDIATSGVTTTSGSTVTNAINGVGSGQISSGINVNFCGTSGPTCSGGANGGPTPGHTFGGNLVLELTSNPLTVDLASPVLRFQNTGPTGNGSDTGLPVPGAVPEPATWAMMLLGFGAIGLTMRRRRVAGGQNLMMQVA